MFQIIFLSVYIFVILTLDTLRTMDHRNYSVLVRVPDLEPILILMWSGLDTTNIHTLNLNGI